MMTAFLVALVLSASILGLVFHFLIFRPLRHTPPLAKVVASVGLFLLMIKNIITLRFAGTFKPVAEPEPRQESAEAKSSAPGSSSNVSNSSPQAWCCSSRNHRADRRVQTEHPLRAGGPRRWREQEKGAGVLGFSPDFLAGTNWALSTVLAGLHSASSCRPSPGSTRSPCRSSDRTRAGHGPARQLQLVLGTTAFAGLGIGMIQALTKTYTAKSWFPHRMDTAIGN